MRRPRRGGEFWATFAQQLGEEHPAVDTAATRRTDQMMRAYEASIPEAERKHVSFYFAEGSHNMDDRGLIYFTDKACGLDVIEFRG